MTGQKSKGQQGKELAHAGHDEHSWFGHFFDGGANAFAAEAGVFDAAVGHGVEAPGGGVADDDGADFEFAEGGQDAAGVAGEEAGLEAVSGVVDFGECVLRSRRRAR